MARIRGAAAVATTTGLAMVGAALAVAQTSGPATPFGAPTEAVPNPGTKIDALAGDRASNWAGQKRSEVLARNGIVATSHPLAAQAGLDMLKRGGNAADAAVAAAATSTVVEPLSAHLGGDMFVLYWSAKDRKLFALNASGWSPKTWTPDYFRGKGYTTSTPVRGADTVTVPGAIDGWDRLLERFGTMRFKEVLEPAAELAEDGFGLTEREHTDWEPWVADLAKDPDSARQWLRNGKAPALYSVFRNPEQAHGLRVLQRKGRDAFYKGEIADAIVRKIRSAGGTMSKDDLASFRSEWVDPISTNYKGYDVHQLPPNTQGFAVLEMLNIVEVCAPRKGVDLAQLGARSPEFWHFLVEAKKLAFNDLLAHNADPRQADVPVRKLISKQYAATLCDRIDLNRAGTPGPANDIQGGTVYLTAADRWGNMVSFIHSIYFPFGAGLTVPDYGVVLHNRGNLFSLDPKSPNVVAPRKRPFTTIIPAFVTKNGQPLLAFGNMGGPVQAQAQATELVNMIDLGMNPQAATDAARFNHSQASNVLELESSLYDAVGPALVAKGHKITLPDPTREGAGGYQAILFERDATLQPPRLNDHRSPVNGVYRAGSDHRKDGSAVGW